MWDARGAQGVQGVQGVHRVGLLVREREAAAHLAVRRAEAAEEKRHAASSHGVDQRAASALSVALQRAVGR